jgi:hypothetical protein
MKNKINNSIVFSLSIFVLVIFLVPNITFASWWNPFSWFKKEIKIEQPTQTPIKEPEVIPVVEKKIETKKEDKIVKPVESKKIIKENLVVKEEIKEVITEPIKENYKLEDVVKEWRPNTVRATCITLDAQGNKKSYSDGSGLLTIDSSKNIFILTNKHVTLVKGSWFNYCDVYFPSNKETYRVEKGEMAISADGKDLARLKILRPTESIKEIINNSKNKRDCKNTTPESTDDIVIMGYPMGKSKDDISYATGKIVGYQDNYFVSDATIISGYSGGVAVSLKDNCFLGTPTYSKKDDSTKSLILDANKF